ncbi:hypothetical protein CVO96_01360 [Deinococcus koreensis]|uniref:Uncharacterized protein n=1 Tax=Deinococcus koreensis TaxID=2054903 RepID=A0A2K3V1Z5_9DEIO|nr:hypothetical protein CVO96_01360 [Deinococcus koreensis]
MTPTARARLSHLAELRDVSSPAEAARASAEFSGEPGFAADLLAVRPWLSPATPKREVLGALLDSEWTGFLALLGEYGPWVYVSTVRDLQTLSARYGELITAASGADEEAVWNASQGTVFPSLLARLEATDYRRPGQGGGDLAALEAAFWAEAAAQARGRYEGRRRNR